MFHPRSSEASTRPVAVGWVDLANRSLFVHARGVLKEELQYHLRTQRKMRHSRFSSTKGTRNKMVDAATG